MDAAEPTDHSHAPAQSGAFRVRRILNWFPVGLTYATLYMGRYNFNVVKGAIGAEFHLDKLQMGVVATAGFWTYGLAVALNGFIADRFGGRRALLIGTVGAAILNLIIGLMFFNHATTNLIVSLSVLYSLNMYFQSFGALSVVKVNSTWFHVRERGVFGGIFGIMISGGYFLAMTANTWLMDVFHTSLVVWFAPAAAISVMAVVDFFVVRNRPSHAGHRDFDTGDGSNAHLPDEAPLPARELIARVVKNPVIRTLIAAEFCTGFVRNGVMLYFTEYLGELYAIEASPKGLYWWTGVAIMLGGICGGLLCGWMSDRLFHSRRPPVAFILYLMQVPALCMLGAAFGRGTDWGQQWAIIAIGITVMFVFSVHGMLSGTASMDFGGRKAAATMAGALDGIQYIGSGLTGFGLGYVLKHWGWDGEGPAPHAPSHAWLWVACIIPFSLMGAYLMTRIWSAKPKHAPSH